MRPDTLRRYLAFCQRSVEFVNKQDNNQSFKFEPLGGGAAADTVIFRLPMASSTQSHRRRSKYSSAWPGWRILAGLLEVLPLSIRDSVYDWVARHRHL
jgi:predicted DCC family thiol-disulfide oxidoreductase YuxK